VHFVARIARSYRGGDHSLFLGRVEFACFSEDARPLLFHGGQYGSLSSAG
jgi:flavin reductase (DIM6/NTAB) family NADH-FMN oxidoreductase RutF